MKEPNGWVVGRIAIQRPGFTTGDIGDMMAEFLGTLVLIAFGDGVVAMAVAALNQSGRGTSIFVAAGDWLLITWGWAMAVAVAACVAGGVTGGHINPAVTFAQAVRGVFPWRKVPGYWLAQVALDGRAAGGRPPRLEEGGRADPRLGRDVARRDR